MNSLRDCLFKPMVDSSVTFKRKQTALLWNSGIRKGEDCGHGTERFCTVYAPEMDKIVWKVPKAISRIKPELAITGNEV